MSEVRAESKNIIPAVEKRQSFSRSEKCLMTVTGVALGIVALLTADTIQRLNMKATLEGEARTHIAGFHSLGGDVGRSLDVLDPEEEMLVELEDGTTCVVQYRKHGSGIPDSILPDEAAILPAY